MKFIENYFITYHTSGIISLTFNTTDRWLNYYQINDHTYRVAGQPDNENYQDLVVTISDEELKFESGVMYIPTHFQNKEQIYFYFIPSTLIKNENDNIIFSKVSLIN